MAGFGTHTAPRKRFGQNFLTDASVIGRIHAAIHALPDDVVVEIGPGRGALTEGLIASGARLHLVEIDRDLAAQWKTREGERLTVHTRDALHFDFAALAAQAGAKLRVVGNLPYNISTPLMFHLLAQGAAIRDMHFMLQREVVERLGAEPNTADYGRLTVMVQYQCRVQPLLEVAPHSFFPPPRVHSAVVRLLPGFFDHGQCRAEARPASPDADSTHESRPSGRQSATPAMLTLVVRQAFTQRRKTLRNALSGLLDVPAMEALGIDSRRRPETLSVAEFIKLADAAALSPAPLPQAGEGKSRDADGDSPLPLAGEGGRRPGEGGD